jgi:hypothetical protein
MLSSDPTDRRLLAIVLLVYIFSAKGYIQVSDTTFSIKTTEAILTSGRLDITYEDGYTVKAPDGRSYSKYGIGLPLYFIPLFAAGQGLARVTGLPAAELIGFLISFANIPFTLLTLVLFALLLRLFGVTGMYARLLTVGLGLGSLCWRYSGYDFSEAMQMGLLLLAVFSVIRGTNGAVMVGGWGFAGLILVKLVHVTLFPIFLGYLLARPRGIRRRMGNAALFTSPVMLALGFIAWLNLVRFGSPLESGYGSEASQFFPSHLWYTIPKLLGSLDKGLFIFSPVLFLGLFGWREFARRFPWEAVLCGALVVSNLMLAGAWHSWVGGWSWGPRLLVPAIPLWLLPAAFWLDHRRTRAWFAVATLVTLASIGVQVPGVLVWDQQIHHIRQNMLTPQEQAWFPSDYWAAYVLLWHKLTATNEVYHVPEFGIPGERELDLTPHQTFKGLNLWTEHVARQFNKPVLRWLAVLGLVVVGYLAVQVWRGRRPKSKLARLFWLHYRNIRRHALLKWG